MSRRRCRGQQGTAAIELVVFAVPLISIMLAYTVVLGRFVMARMDVDGAARNAARAASIQRTAAEATRAARDVVASTLSSAGLACRGLHVAVDTAQFRPHGQVVVALSCDVDLSDVNILHLPAFRVVTSRFVSPIDVYRSTTR